MIDKMLYLPYECKVNIPDESWNHANDQHEQEARGENHDRNRQRNGRNHLLDKAPNGLDHIKPVRSLNPGPLQAIVKNWIFIRQKIEARSVFHNAYAYVVGVPAREQGVGIINHPPKNAASHRKGKLNRDQPPEPRSYRLMSGDDVEDRIDDEF